MATPSILAILVFIEEASLLRTRVEGIVEVKVEQGQLPIYLLNRNIVTLSETVRKVDDQG